jgi:nicotinamidase/pyrazinamidase
MQISSRDALLVIDVQNDFTRGSMAIPGADSVIAPINRLAARFPNVIVVTDWHPPGHVSFASTHPGTRPGDTVPVSYGDQAVWADHCVQDSWGAQLDAGLALGSAQLVLRKGYRAEVDSYGCFYENDQSTATGLAAYLRARGITRVFCTGLARFACVAHSALGAARDGFAVVIVRDATAGRPRDTDAAMQSELDRAGVEWVGSHDLAGY